MKYQTRKRALVLLADGTIFYGKSVGIEGTSTGEICFNTGMTGYQEIFTDPSYFGQIMVTANAHIGNYGINDNEVESDGILDSHQAVAKTGTQLGVIAQELELICPDCVTTESSGVKTVSGDNLHWHMLNAIKELSTQNAALAARLTTLEEG